MKALKISVLSLVLGASVVPTPATALTRHDDDVKGRIERTSKSYEEKARKLEDLKKLGKSPLDQEVMLLYIDMRGDCTLIAFWYEEIRAYAEAYAWFERAAKVAEECNDYLLSAKHLSTFDAYFGMARSSWMRRRYSDAAMNCQIAIVRARPTDRQRADAHLLHARLDLIEEDYKSWEVQANLAMGLWSNNKEGQAVCHRVIAAGCYLQGNLSEAKASWQAAAALDGVGRDGDLFDPYQAPLNAAIAKNPKDVEARISRAKYLLHRGDNLSRKINDAGAAPLYLGGITNIAALTTPSEFSFEESALLDITRARAVDPDNPLLLILSAVAKEAYNARGGKTDRYKASSIVDDISWASVMATTEPEALIELAKVLQKRGASKDAMGYFARGFHHSKSGTDLAELKEIRQQLFKSLPCPAWSAAPKVTPKTSLEWKERGNAFNNAGDWRGALACYSKAVELDPKNADALNNIGLTMMRQGAIDWALDYLNRAIKIAPMHHMAYSSRAQAWAYLKQPNQALDDVDKAVKYAKASEIKSLCLALKSRILGEQHKPDEAATAAEEALKLVPSNLMAQEGLGIAHVFQSKPQLATKDLDSTQQGMRAKLVRCVALSLAKDSRYSTVWAEVQQSASITDLGWILHWLDGWLASAIAPVKGSSDFTRLQGFASDVRSARQKTLLKL